MEIKDIPVPEIRTNMRPEVQELRRNSPLFFASLCEPLHHSGVFQDIANIADIPVGNMSVLEGGAYSACYWVKDRRDVVIKFGTRGIEAEVEWLSKCRDAGISVPTVQYHGVIPIEIGKPQPVKYIALEGIKNEQGNLAETGIAYLKKHEDLRVIAKLMGSELAKIHTVISSRQFGGFSDIWGAHDTKNNWSEYLENNLRSNKPEDKGITPEEVEGLARVFGLIQFPKEGSYLHGDFGLHNVLITAMNPAKIVIFDPLPLIGDPYFDLATQYNLMELRRAKHEAVPSNKQYQERWESINIYFNNLMSAYESKSGKVVDMKRLAANQLVRLIKSVEYEKGIDDSQLPLPEREDRKLELDLRKKFIMEKVSFLLGKNLSDSS